MVNKKPALIVAGVAIVLLIVGVLVMVSRPKSVVEDAIPDTTGPKPRVNLIPIADRPYVTLEPLSARNELQLTVRTLPQTATTMEVLLEYNRNKGVMDAVLKTYSLTKIPSINKIFLGSKSTGGHTTYHDDVVGGKLTLTFSAADDSYALEVPWRYDDTQPRYTQISTSDLKFQIVLDEPYRTPKIVVMQSPGLPVAVNGQVLAGPYVVRGVGVIPKISGLMTIRLPEAVPDAKLLIFDGQTWQPHSAVIDDRTLTAKVPLAETYLVIK